MRIDYRAVAPGALGVVGVLAVVALVVERGWLDAALVYPIHEPRGTTLGPYAAGDGAVALAQSVVAHGSAVHLWKNVLALVLGVALARRVLGWPAIAAVLLGFGLVGNWAHAVVFGAPTYGASAGTFALLGVAGVVGARAWPVATAVGVLALAGHQALLADPSIALAHAAVALGGVVVGVGLVGEWACSGVGLPVRSGRLYTRTTSNHRRM